LYPIPRHRQSRSRPKATQRCLQSRCAGFSLVEIMVGMVIGMLGIIVMMQVFALAEAQKRSTTGGGDAQSNGAIALYGIQRDIRQAGYGLSDVNLLGCNLQLRTAPSVVTLPSIAPLTINHPSIPAGDANTDTLLVVYGNASVAPQGDGITAQPLAWLTYHSPQIYSVMAPGSFNVGDQVIARPPNRASPCNLTMEPVVAVPAPGDTSYNVEVATGQLYGTGSRLHDLGPAPKIWAYAIRNGNLTFCDYMANDCSVAGNTGNAAIWVPIASNVVSLRAQYAKDTNTPMDGIVDTYNQTAPATACDWAKTLGVDIVMVARNGNFEKNPVTPSAPTWTGTPTIPIILSADSNWQYYRYKVFETVIPIRNVLWMGAQAGC
jgi:type IV pilus assembly protein PilW